jgi:intracellular septation protein
VTERDVPPTEARALSPRQKLAVELGPLLVFFVGYFVAKRFVGDTPGMIWATGAFLVATICAIAVSYAVERKVQPMTLVTGVVVLVMGGLTIALADETFIKRKPTLVSGVFGATLLGGLAVGRPLVKPLLGSAIDLDDEGWRKLTLRWGLFFLFIAALNEVVWRRMSTETWITFKTFGILPLTFVFLLFQGPLLERHRVDREEAAGDR